MKKTYFIWLIIVWTLFVSGSLILNISTTISSNDKLVENVSRTFFEQIIFTREWNSRHQGVYVPITATTQPNPYLEDSLRDVVTTGGLKLTKINPAYMTRQISEIQQEHNNVQFHITSLNPIRPANKPDWWEAKVLESFETGNREKLELIKKGSIGQYRYMAPLVTEQSCLKCHAKQGYRVGDIRGGISVTIPSAPYLTTVNRQLLLISLFHLLILMIGIVGSYLFYRKLNQSFAIIHNKNTELSQLNATKDKLFSIIAHDLKSPFTSILGFSELLLENVRQYDVDITEDFLKNINSSAQHTLILLQNLLTWANTQTRQIQFKPETIDLQHIIDDILDATNSSALIKHIAIEYIHTTEVKVYADPNMLKTILRNLVSNAIKFTHEHGKIEIIAIAKDNLIEITVSDHGVGMSEEIKGKLFDISENITTAGTNKEKGTGLGLILCKEFTEKHGGQIWVNSEKGKGSAFTFTLPAKP